MVTSLNLFQHFKNSKNHKIFRHWVRVSDVSVSVVLSRVDVIVGWILKQVWLWRSVTHHAWIILLQLVPSNGWCPIHFDVYHFYKPSNSRPTHSHFYFEFLHNFVWLSPIKLCSLLPLVTPFQVSVREIYESIFLTRLTKHRWNRYLSLIKSVRSAQRCKAENQPTRISILIRTAMLMGHHESHVFK